MTSAALAAAIMPNRKALAAKIVRIDFIYEPPFRKGADLFRYLFCYP